MSAFAPTINYNCYDTLIDSDAGSYKWQGNTYTESGEYVYEGQAEAGCDSSIVLRLTISEISISAVDELGNINLFPNPTIGKVTIIADGIAKVEVFDQNGRIVTTFLNTNVIDIQRLTTGSYTLRITLLNGIAIKRIINQ